MHTLNFTRTWHRQTDEFKDAASSHRTMNWQAIWRHLTTTKYTIFLEDTIDRLLEENRGLLNSLLTRAGVQPIDKPGPMPHVGRRLSRNQRQVQIEREWLARQAKPNA